MTNSKLFLLCSLLLLYFWGTQWADAACVGGGVFWSTSLGQCVPCIGATFCAGDCTNSCNACPTNSAPNIEKTNCVSGSCVLCPIGYYCGGGTMVIGCPAGTYGDDVGFSVPSQCLDCAAGKYGATAGISACVQCSPGTFTAVSRSVGCALCGTGTYQPNYGSNACLDCRKGTYSGVQGVVSGTDCQMCAPGFYGPYTGMSLLSIACLPCSQGTYGAGSGLIDIQNCTACVAGTYSAVYGAVSVLTCTNCSKGQYQPLAGMAVCVGCPKDTYQNVTGATTAWACAYCLDHSMTLDFNATDISQCLCKPGYSGTNGGICKACGGGQYASVPGQLTCTLCPPNTYDTTTGLSPRENMNTVCTSVPNNSISSAGSVDFTCVGGYVKDPMLFSCPQCGPNTYSQTGGPCQSCVYGTTDTNVVATTIADCKCNAGYFKASSTSVCTICPKGFYCIGGRQDNQPVQCAVGRDTSGTGFSAASSCVCQPGYFNALMDNSQCAVCSAASYCPLNSLSQISCPLNTNSPLGSDRLLLCSCKPGYKPVSPAAQGSNGTNCTICPTFEYCMSGTESMCRNNSMAAVAGQSSESGCLCNAGFYSQTTTSICIQCPQNSYCTGGLNLTSCPLNAVTFGATERTNLSDCGCDGGYYGSMTIGCTGCPPDSYCSNNNMAGCTPFSNSPALSTVVQACTCNKGYYGTFQSCAICGKGTYTNVSNSSQCIGCVPGTYSEAIAAVSQATCQFCAQGTWSGTVGYSTPACISCVGGQYSETLGASSIAACLSCSEGSWSVTVGANTPNTCTLCDKGSYSNTQGALMCTLCGAGLYGTGTGRVDSTSGCIQCPPGSYSGTMGLQALTACQLCASGTYSPTFGATSVAVCGNCAKGTYSTSEGLNASSGCVQCAPGTYGVIEGSKTLLESCTQCDYGTYSTGWQANITCQLCPSGTYNPIMGAFHNSSCIACGMGTYSADVGMTKASVCVACGTGAYGLVLGGNSFDSSCVQCEAGSFSWATVATSASNCTSCPPGTFSKTGGAASEASCLPCSAGSFSWIRATRCDFCSPGTLFKNATTA